MRISHRHRFVFFSNPKTGSESIRAMLDPLSDVRDVPFHLTRPDFPFYSHIRPIEMRAAFLRFGWRYEDYYRFVFVRNPWARLLSLYRYAQRADIGLTLSFTDWLKTTRPDGSGGGGPDHLRWLKYGTYSLEAFAGDGAGRLLVNDVFRLEDMNDVPDRLRLRRIPLPAGGGVPWVNRTKEATDYGRYYTPEAVALVRDRYASEIERFGYTYPG